MESILAGDHLPGAFLPTESMLIDRFAVSRTAIREALQLLSARGFVSVEHGRGARVTEHYPQAISGLLRFQLRQQHGNLEHILEVRRMLEVTAATLAVSRASADDVERMESALTAMAASQDSGAYIAADLAFHKAIVVAARNPVMELLNDAITHLLVGMREQTYHVPGAVAQSLEDHRWVCDAIAAHDPERARAVMVGVLNQVEGAIRLIEGQTQGADGRADT
mgnify:CR=1 FL=1